MSLPIIRDLLDEYFNEEELQALSFDLNIPYKNLPGNIPKLKAQSLLEYCLQRQCLPQLIQRCRDLRPDVAWPDGAAAVAAHPLTEFYHQTIAALSTPRYQLDHRFVRLTLLLDQGPDAQGIRHIPDAKYGKYDSLTTLLADVEERALVLLGSPGSGKTTLLLRLQLEHAWAQLAQPTAHISFFVPLNSYRPSRVGDTPPDPLTWLAQEWQMKQPNLPDFTALFQAGRLLLLLDGLNELPHRGPEAYEEIVALWQRFLQQAVRCGNQVVFSCRELDYSVSLHSETAPVRQVQVEPLTSAQIEEFLTLYLAAQAASVWQTLRQDKRQLTLFATPFFLRLLVDQVLATGELLTSRVTLLTGFVRRALYREIEEHHHPLFRPDALLTRNDVQQVMQNRWVTPLTLPQQGVLLPKLVQLAYDMQAGRSTRDAVQVRIPEDTALDLLHHPLAADMLSAGIQLNVLDKDLTRLEITYFHQLLQEYFAARLLAQKSQPELVKTAWRAVEMPEQLADWLETADVAKPLPAAPTTGWEETTVMAAAMTPEPEKFVRDLMAANLPLAARCAAEPDVLVSEQLQADLQQRLIQRLADPQADLRARIAAAEALGSLGDPRFERRQGPHGAYLCPPLVPVPAGVYPIGADDSDFAQEKPAHTVEMAAFDIGMFAVTNAEYALFMEAGGYADERWWQTVAAKAWLSGAGDNEGSIQAGRDLQKYIQGFSEETLKQQKVSPEQIEFWLWIRKASAEELESQYKEWYPSGKIYRQPAYWDDSRFNHPARPVVGVTWFEARAYCAWLSAQTDCLYDLPTEVMWEAAARGLEGREYAYGAGYDNGRCNTFESHIRATTPVGVFPQGCTPAGIHDLSGNVWEWTTTLWGQSLQNPDYRYPYTAADGRENLDDGISRRVLRGGAWNRNSNHARAASRNNFRPDYRISVFGFRVALVRRSPSHQDH